MTINRSRIASTFSTRFFVIIAACALVASIMGVTAYMQKISVKPVEKPQQPAERLSLKNVTRETKEGEAQREVESAPPQDVLAPQATSNYAFTTATNASLTDMSTGTTQLVAADQDDTASSATNIGFDFYFQGTRFTQFSANSNGLLRLGSTAVQGASPYKPLAQASIPLITAYGADQRTLASTGKVHFKVIGSAPNRTLVVEWLNMQANFNSGGTSDLTYQARLSETTGVIEYVYGKATMSTAGAADANSRDPNIGFSSSNTAGTVGSVTAAQSGTPAPTFDGASATAVANLYTAGTIPVLDSATNGSRRIFTFTPPTPTAPTNLTFTGVTASAMTLNWTDSADETLYAIYRSTDGTNFSFFNTTAQNVATLNVTGLNPSTAYFWQVYAVSEGALSTALAGSQATNAAATISSTGAGGNWSSTATWVGGAVPTAADNVVIVDGATVTVDVTTATCLNLTVGQGTSGTLQYISTPLSTLTVNADVTVASGATFTAGAGTLTTHNLNIGGSTSGSSAAGNLTVNGTFDMNTTAGVTTNFFGSTNGTVSGSGATCDFFAIVMNKGTSITPVEDVTRVITMNAPAASANRLSATNGTFKLSSASTLTPWFGSQTLIAATGRLWLNNAGASTNVVGIGTGTGAGSPTINGTLQVDHGTFGYGSGNNTLNIGTGSAGAALIIGGTDATVNMFGIVLFSANSTFTMTAGNFNVDPQAANSTAATNNIVRFSGPNNVAFTGGMLTIVDPHSATGSGRALSISASSAATYNFTGSTISFGNGVSTTAGSVDGFDIDTFVGLALVPIGNVTINNTATNATTRFVRVNTALSPFQTTFGGDLNITNAGGSELRLNGNLVAIGGNVTNNGIIDGSVASSRLYFAGSSPQQYSGTGVAGTVALPLQSVDFDSTGGVTFNAGTTNNLITSRIIIFTGNITNANKLTLGVGGTSIGTVQIGNTTTATNAGAFDVAPTFNLGSGGEVISYLRTTNARTTGGEINPTRTLTSMTYDDNDATHALTIAGGDLTLSNTATALTLTNGRVVTGSNVLALSSGTATVTRTNGYVDGNLRKTYTATGSKTFEVGTANAYSPVAANVTAGTGTFTAKAVQGKLPQISGTNALARYWTLAGTGLTANLTFTYLATDVTGTVANYQFIKNSGGALSTLAPTGTPTSTSATINGVSSFSDWTLAEPGAVQSGTIQFDSPTYSVSEGASSVTLTVTRAGGSDGAVSVQYTTVDGTATSGAGNDYTGQSGILGWAAGDTGNKTIVVALLGDSVYEGDENFSVNVNTPTGGATLGSPAAATVTINDNDSQPTLQVDDVTQAEGNSGTTAFTFTVSKTGATAVNASVNYTTADGTTNPATGGAACGSGVDYITNSGSLTFLPADTSKQITVQVCGDTDVEPDETFFVNFNSPMNAVMDDQGIGTITNDDVAANNGSIQLSAATYSGGEGDGQIAVTITRTGGSDGAVAVTFDTSNGSATAGSDYTAVTGQSVMFADGDAANKTVNISVTDDSEYEGAETFNVTLSNPTGGATLGSPASAVVTINDNDARPAPTVVCVDDDFASLSAGDDPPGPCTEVGYDAFATIQAGVNAVATGGTVNVAAGTYHEDVAVNNNGLQLLGAGAGAVTISGAIGGDTSTVRIFSNNVTIAGFTITRDGNTVAQWNDPGLNSAGIAIQGLSVTGALIRDNILTGNRTGLDINNSGGHTVRNNTIDFNRTGFIFRNQTDNMTVTENFVRDNWTVGVLFLDASGGTNSPLQQALHSGFNNNDISANWYGQVVDRQSGGSLPAPGTTNLKNFRNNWLGTTSPVVTTANSTEPGYAAQIPVAYGGSATAPGGQPDIAGPASANIKYIPFLLDGTDTNVETTPGRGTNGFQGVQPATVVVRANNLNGWVPTQSGTAMTSFVVGPATPPLGEGSGQLSVGTDGDSAAQFRQTTFNGTPLSDLTALSYSTYTSQDGSGGQTVYILLNVDRNADGTLDTLLFFEPEYQHGQTNAVPDQGDNLVGVWQTWNARIGGWYGIDSTNGDPVFAGPGANVLPLDNFITANPNARLNVAASGSLRLVAGFGAGAWDNFVGNVDNVKVGVNAANTTYDFEPLPRLSISDVTMTEGNAGQTAFNFNVTLSGTNDQTVTVDYATADDTATAPSDYTAVPPTQLTFMPGETMKTVTVQVNGDLASEPDETFFVNLSNVNANATILDGQGVGTIQNDDIQFAIDDVTHMEGNSGTNPYVFTVTKSGAAAASVDFTTVDGTATTADNDYQSNSGTLNFGAADTTMQITVLVNGDTAFEANETFTVHLSNAMGATISDADGTGTIQNDDACVTPSTVYVDDSWVGTPIGSDPDGAGPAMSFGCDSFATIQEGVTAVPAGGTVVVNDGTYTENVTIAKAMTLKGAQFGVDARGRSASESVVMPASTSLPTFTVAFNGLITIDGFSFSGGVTGASGVIFTSVGPNDNMQIVNNRFSNYPAAAIWLNRGGANITIDKNVLDGSNISGSGQAIFANGPQSYTGLFITNNNIVNNTGRNGFFVDGNHNVGESATRAPLISGNLFNNNAQGMNLGSRSFGTLGTPVLGPYGGTISNNTFSNHPNNGIQAGIQHVLVSGNAFSNNTVDGLALTSFGNTGADRGAQNSTIVSNYFTGNGRAGLFFSGTQGTGLIETNHANFNRIVGNAVGVQYGGSVAAGNNATIDVENNWWGCNYGPGATGAGCGGTTNGTLVFAGNSGVLDSDPWLVLSISASPNPIPPGGMTTVTADMTHNSNGAVPSNTIFLPPTPVTFGATNGNVSPPTGTVTNGQATTTFTSNSLMGGTASATVDGQTVSTNINIVLPSFSIDDVTHMEGDSGTTMYTFTVTKTGATSFGSSVDFTTVDGTATVADNDYTANSGTLTFGAADTMMQLTVLVNGDTTFEPDEAFTVHLSNAMSATITDADGTGTIQNDDPQPVGMSINDVFVSEPTAGTSTAVFTVTLAAPAASTVTVDYATADGTATAPADYVAIPPTQLMFTPGQTSNTISVTVNADAITEGNETFFVNLSNPSNNATITDGQGQGTITDPVAAGDMLISEFRFRGPTFSVPQNIDGFRDEYVELYNNTNSPITVATTDGSAGWTLAASNASATGADVLITIPNGTVIPARAHFLAVNSDEDTTARPDRNIVPDGGYSLNAYAVGDAFYVTDIADNAGVALFNTATVANFTPATRFDAAGFAGPSGATADLFREGAGLASPGANDGNYAFVRKLTTGLPQDTSDNAQDFVFVAPDGGLYGGVQSVLGAPGPENCGCYPANQFADSSPIQRNATIKASLIEPQAVSTAPPNRIRDTNATGPNAALGTLELRRRFKNTTMQTVTRLRFRAVDITTLNTPNPGGQQSDIRWLTSGDMPVTTSLGNLTLRGTVIQTPPAQPLGGGLNSSGALTVPVTLMPGASVDVRFVLGVQTGGRFRFFVNVEALP